MLVSISYCKWNAETGNTWIGSKPTQNWTSDTESWRGYAQAGVRKHVFTLRKKADPGLPSCLFWRNWNHSAAKQVPNFCRKVAFFFLETKVGLLGTSPWEQPSGEFMEVPGPFNTSKSGSNHWWAEQSKKGMGEMLWSGSGGRLLPPDHYEQRFLLVACKLRLSRNSQISPSSFIASP